MPAALATRTPSDAAHDRALAAEGPSDPTGEPAPEPASVEAGSRPGHPDPEPAPEVLDPFTDADALGELEHRLTTLAAHIAAATHRFLVLLADFDRRRGWELGGHRSCAHWLEVATALDARTARSRVRVARALEGLPRTSEAMSRGELSFSQVRALSRVATPACEAELIDYARSTTVRELERFVRMWRTLSRADDERLERARYRLRRFSVVPDDEGMYVVRGRVTAEVGAVLMRAVDAAGDALFNAASPDLREETTPKQRRCDALGLVAERALAAGFGASPASGDGEAADADPDVESPESGSREPAGRTDDEVGASGPQAAGAGGGVEVPISGTRAERYQVLLHVTARGARLEDGTVLATATARRLCCDTGVVQVNRHPSDGSILDVGRRTRTIPPSIRRALEVRDGGCVFPGCGLRFTDGHHLRHWSDGGETKLDNLVLLCRFHHRKVHEGGWRVQRWGRKGTRRVVFIDPNGGVHADPGPKDDRRPMPGLPERPVDALKTDNRDRGLHPTGWDLWAGHDVGPGEGSTLRARTVEALDAAHFGV